MKRFLLLVVLAAIAFGGWFYLGHDRKVVGMVKQDGILMPDASAKLLWSSSLSQHAEHVLECRWSDVALGKEDSILKVTLYSREEGLQNAEVRERIKKLERFAFGEFSWPNAKLYSGASPGLVTDFLVVHFADDRVLIWYSVE